MPAAAASLLVVPHSLPPSCAYSNADATAAHTHAVEPFTDSVENSDNKPDSTETVTDTAEPADADCYAGEDHTAADNSYSAAHTDASAEPDGESDSVEAIDAADYQAGDQAADPDHQVEPDAEQEANAASNQEAAGASDSNASDYSLGRRAGDRSRTKKRGWRIENGG